MLTPLTETPEEHAYDLCVSHATRTSPPRGWLLQDRRPDLRPTGQPVDPELLGSPDTVALLARALRAVPDATDHLDALSGIVDPIVQASSAIDAAIAGDGRPTARESSVDELQVRPEDQPALEW